MKNVFFGKILKLWEDGENGQAAIDKLVRYYNGREYQNPADSFFIKEDRTPLNIIGQVVDAKHTATLDAQFSASVIPQVYNFGDVSAIKDMQDVANVLNKGLKDVLRANKEDDIKERALRWALIKRGAVQTVWDVKDGQAGEIKLKVVDPRIVRYTKTAKDVDELTMVAYASEIDATILKKDYARLPDGSFDVELCKKIDEAAGNKVGSDKGQVKAIASYSVDSGAGLAYVRDSQSQGAGKTVTVVVMFLFDGTLETPADTQNADDEALAQEMRMNYPNGRIVTFVPDKDKEIILKDEAAPECFKSLGNIDFLILNKLSGFDVESTVEKLVPIQERINGSIRKLRAAVGGNINTVLFDERMRGVVEDNSFVNLSVVFVEGLGNFQPPVLNNGGIDQAMQLRQLIESYKQDAYETERINRAWISGENQENVKSGDHADTLNESAMASIRAIQRCFSDFWVSISEKVVALIIENYTEQRLIELGTGVSAKQYAMFDTATGPDGQPQKMIHFLDEAGKIARTIKIDPSWRYKVEISDGTAIPRSRRENARLVDEVAASPTMQSGDIDMIDMYLTAKDFPNKNAIIELLKKKQDEKAKNPVPVLEQLMSNPQLLTAWGNLFKDLAGFSAAQGELLKKAGLDSTTDTITSAPAQSITAKSSADKIAVIAPQQISQNPTQAQFGHEQATDMTVIEHTKNHKPNVFPEEGI